jgi:hypothetical protein
MIERPRDALPNDLEADGHFCPMKADQRKRILRKSGLPGQPAAELPPTVQGVFSFFSQDSNFLIGCLV